VALWFVRIREGKMEIVSWDLFVLFFLFSFVPKIGGEWAKDRRF
jgi:hypothetical protein